MGVIAWIALALSVGLTVVAIIFAFIETRKE